MTDKTSEIFRGAGTEAFLFADPTVLSTTPEKLRFCTTYSDKEDPL